MIYALDSSIVNLVPSLLDLVSGCDGQDVFLHEVGFGESKDLKVVFQCIFIDKLLFVFLSASLNIEYSDCGDFC